MTEEFYVMDGKLVYAFICGMGTGGEEGKDKGLPGKEFYFDNGKLIKYVIQAVKDPPTRKRKRKYMKQSFL